MQFKLLIGLLLTIGLWSLSSFVSPAKSSEHPLKLTASLIEYNPATASLSMQCRVFIDDFEISINKDLAKGINVSVLTEADKAGIEAFFERSYVSPDGVESIMKDGKFYKNTF